MNYIGGEHATRSTGSGLSLEGYGLAREYVSSDRMPPLVARD